MFTALHPDHSLRALEIVPENRKTGRFARVVAEASARDVNAAGGGDALCEIDGIEVSERFDILDPRPFPLKASDEFLAVIAEPCDGAERARYPFAASGGPDGERAALAAA